MDADTRRRAIAIAAAIVLGDIGFHGTGLAQTKSASHPSSEQANGGLEDIQSQIERQTDRLDDQDRRLKEQDVIIRSLHDEIEMLRSQSAGNGSSEMRRGVEAQSNPKLRAEGAQTLEGVRGTGILTAPAMATPPVMNAGAGMPASLPRIAAASDNVAPNRPVGEAPTPTTTMEDITALPEGVRVLTPRDSFVVESSVEYDRTSSNRLVFRGVEIVPGIQLGLIDANDVARDTAVGTVDLRYGIFDRVEVEARIPYFYRHDRLTVLSQQITATVPAAIQTTSLEGNHLGDIEFAVRYQLNRALEGGAIYVAGVRAKSITGIGPYDVNFDSNGIATSLGTGSGFWAVEPSLTVLLPSDPVVIFANFGYLHSFERNINKDIGTTHVGLVTPGDGFDLSLGFGFSLNPQFSFSLGFSNTYILATRMEFGTTVQRSTPLEAGSLTMGWSYILSPTLQLSNNFEFGVTSDAPDMRVLVRVPYRF
jgi:hypothetical protein